MFLSKTAQYTLISALIRTSCTRNWQIAPHQTPDREKIHWHNECNQRTCVTLYHTYHHFERIWIPLHPILVLCPFHMCFQHWRIPRCNMKLGNEDLKNYREKQTWGTRHVTKHQRVCKPIPIVLGCLFAPFNEWGFVVVWKWVIKVLLWWHYVL